jgi:hypothetical protein
MKNVRTEEDEAKGKQERGKKERRKKTHTKKETILDTYQRMSLGLAEHFPS